MPVVKESISKMHCDLLFLLVDYMLFVWMHNSNCKEIVSSSSLLNFGQCNCASCNYFYSQYHERLLLLLGDYSRYNYRNPLKFKARYIFYSLLAKRFQIYSNIMQYGKRLCGMSQETKIPTPYCKTPEPQLRTIFWFCRRRCSYARISTCAAVAVSRVP